MITYILCKIGLHDWLCDGVTHSCTGCEYEEDCNHVIGKEWRFA